MSKRLGAIFSLLFLFGGISVSSQTVLEWELLAQTTYEYTYNETFNQWLGNPTFPADLLALDGQQISISGYVLPMDVEGDFYVLSAFPYVSCFFCGGAGMESVMELNLLKKGAKFKVDEYKTFSGILHLNKENFELTFTLEEAEILNQ